MLTGSMTTALRLTAALAVGLALGGCTSFQGTRLYGSGSEALERGETSRADMISTSV